MLTAEASKALAPPGPPWPCDQVSWSWAPVTPHPNPPSPPGPPSWPTDLLEPHARVSRPSTSCSSDPTGPPMAQGPFVSHLQPAALKAPHPSPHHRRTGASWPVSPAQCAQGWHTSCPPVAASTLRPGTASCEAAAPGRVPETRRPQRTHLGAARGSTWVREYPAPQHWSE